MFPPKCLILKTLQIFPTYSIFSEEKNGEMAQNNTDLHNPVIKMFQFQPWAPPIKLKGSRFLSFPCQTAWKTKN